MNPALLLIAIDLAEIEPRYETKVTLTDFLFPALLPTNTST
jgi:hypothetical protein